MIKGLNAIEKTPLFIFDDPIQSQRDASPKAGEKPPEWG